MYYIHVIQLKKKTEIEAYIGNIKITKFSSTNFFHIYVSVMLINNTNRDFFIEVKESEYGLIKESNFKGIIGQDTLFFGTSIFPRCIQSHDTLIGHLAYEFYDPKIPDHLFYEKVKCMDMKYSLPTDSIKRDNNLIQELHFERRDSSKFIHLKDNIGIEGAFLFGVYEFMPFLLDTTIMSSEKSLVTGDYIYDLCPPVERNMSHR